MIFYTGRIWNKKDAPPGVSSISTVINTEVSYKEKFQSMTSHQKNIIWIKIYKGLNDYENNIFVASVYNSFMIAMLLNAGQNETVGQKCAGILCYFLCVGEGGGAN